MIARKERALWIVAGVGFGLLFIGVLAELPYLATVGGAVVALPVIVAVARMMVNPPDIGETINAEMVGLPKYEKPTEMSQVEARASIRDTVEEPRPK